MLFSTNALKALECLGAEGVARGDKTVSTSPLNSIVQRISEQLPEAQVVSLVDNGARPALQYRRVRSGRSAGLHPGFLPFFVQVQLRGVLREL